MIRAVVNNGVITPLEPLPLDWQNGREVVVDAAEEPGPPSTEDMDKWSQDMKALTAGLNDQGEWQAIEAALVEADRHNKVATTDRDFDAPPDIRAELVAPENRALSDRWYRCAQPSASCCDPSGSAS